MEKNKFKSFMDTILLNNLGYKLMSLLVAIMVWIIVINIADPITTKKFNGIKVDVLNQSAITSINQVFEVVEGDTIDFVVKGKSSIVKNLTSEDFYASADLSQLSKVYATPIMVVCEKADNVEIDTGNKMLSVKLENIQRKTVQVTVETTGKVSQGYFVGDYEVKPNMVVVSGGESKVEMIDTVKVKVNVDGAKKSFSDLYEPVAYDEDGNEIDSSNFTYMNSGTRVSEVKVGITIYKTKEVPVEIDIEGVPNENYKFIKDYEFTPKTVSVAGTGKELKRIDKISIPVDITGAEGTFETNVNLSSYIPDGIRNVSGKDAISVRVFLAEIITRQIDFNISNISLKNIPEEYFADINNNDTAFSIMIKGTADEIKHFTAENIGAYVDLQDTEEGDNSVEIQFAEVVKNYLSAEKQFLNVKLVEKKEVEEELVPATLAPDSQN